MVKQSTKPFRPDFTKIPHQPGCYLMSDQEGRVIYVGKAIDLRKRLSSYWRTNKPDIKTARLIEKVVKVDFMVTDSESEALILENQLIKQHYPKFNVLLRDDKSYQYIRIDLNQAYPVVEIVRNPHAIKQETRVRYFGPYTSGMSVKYLVQLINKIFPLCTNAEILNKTNKTKPCLNWHLGKCLGVCAGRSSSKAYHQMINEIVNFLSGKSKDWRKYLEQRMAAAATDKKFEEALKLREQITAIDSVVAKQKVAQPNALISQDIWGWFITAEQAVVIVLKVRSGKVIDYQTFVLRLPMEIDLAEFAEEAMRSIYAATLDNWPKEVIMPHLPKDHLVLEDWLSNLAGHTIKINLPKRGIKKQLSLLVQKNAVEQASAKVGDNLQTKTALIRLQDLLHIQQIKRMEAYDISHLGGTATVGSMVVFQDGKPTPAQYRRFRIKTVRGIDDYASLGEVIRRRLSSNRLRDQRFAANLPDLILIDGGKGQLNTVLKSTNTINLPNLPIIISLAKKEETIFTPTDMQGINLSLSSPELQLLQRLRDEAHRFAITYQTALRGKQAVGGLKIKGIGPGTQKKLVRQFGSMKAAKTASPAELEKILGKRAQLLLKHWGDSYSR